MTSFELAALEATMSGLWQVSGTKRQSEIHAVSGFAALGLSLVRSWQMLRVRPVCPSSELIPFMPHSKLFFKSVFKLACWPCRSKEPGKAVQCGFSLVNDFLPVHEGHGA